MGLIAWLFAGLKGEVEWLIASLSVAPVAHEDIASANQPASDAATAHHEQTASAPDLNAIATLVPVADGDVTDYHATIDIPHTDAAAVIIPADFVVDDLVHTNFAAPLQPVTLLSDSFVFTGIGDASAAQASQTVHDFSTLDGWMAGVHAGSPLPLSNAAAGDFALASLEPQLRGGFAHGGGTSGAPTGGTAPAPYDTLINGGINHGLEIVIKFDASVANAPKLNGVNEFVTDVDQVANFFASNFITADGTLASPTKITIDAGYGEIEGSKLGNGVLGESDAWYTTVSKSTNNATQYAVLQGAFNNVATVEQNHGSQVVNIPASDPSQFTAGQQWWVTTAEGKALGLAPSDNSVDGYFGIASSGFFYGSTPVKGQYDFTGTVAHEISEVMGRVTLNGEKYSGYPLPEYSPLDLFHFADSTGAPIYAGGTAGHFALAQGGTALEEFNTINSGDFSDWAATGKYAVDAYDWSGGAGSMSPVYYSDYLAMEAVGWAGIDPVSGVVATTNNGMTGITPATGTWTPFG